MSQLTFTVIVSFLTDFVISAGGALTTAMVATGVADMPTIPVWIFAAITGLIAASRRVQALLAPSPAPPKPPEEPSKISAGSTP